MMFVEEDCFYISGMLFIMTITIGILYMMITNYKFFIGSMII
jgi:hypothetical protein